jgi:hypothetical protein
MKRTPFNTLPHQLQIDVIETLMSYDHCHIEHSHGSTYVSTSYCLHSGSHDDEWLGSTFAILNRNTSMTKRYHDDLVKAHDEYFRGVEDGTLTNDEARALYLITGKLEDRAAEIILEYYDDEIIEDRDY